MIRQRRRILANNSNSMTHTEQEVMARWDAGASMHTIARTLPLHLDRVRSIVSNFHDTGEHGRDCAIVANGSAALAAAIHQARNQA